MKKLFASLLFLSFTVLGWSQVPDNAKISEPMTKYEAAYKMAEQAENLIQAGRNEEALQILEHAQKLDNTSVRYSSLKAEAYMNMGEYEKAAKLLAATSGAEDVTPYNYRLLGKVFEKMGEKDRALMEYHSGLQTFDKSGLLFAAAGEWHDKWGEQDSALWYFREGMTQDPTESENYYQLATYHSEQGNHAWTILHGEAFMVLESGSERTEEMSKLLLDTYRKAIDIKSKNEIVVDFGAEDLKLDVREGGVKNRLPFPYYIEQNMKMAVAEEKRTNWKNKEMPDKLTIEMIHRIRWYFQKAWFTEDSYKNYDSPLFEYYQEIAAAGYLEAFDYWYLMKGNQDEFDAWYERSGELYEEFTKWFQENELEISGDRLFFSEA